jgi:dTMP kinase
VPFVALEGLDGSGKTSVAAAVAGALQRGGREVVLTGEPTKTWLGDAVRRAIAEDTEAVTESFLFLADRAAHTAHIRRWLSEGKTVVCDRYTGSTLAYQGARLEGSVDDPVGWLRRLSGLVAVEPDLTVLLRVDPATGLARIAERGKRVRFEEAEFLRRVFARYETLAAEGGWRVVDAARALPAVTADVLAAVEGLPPA